MKLCRVGLYEVEFDAARLGDKLWFFAAIEGCTYQCIPCIHSLHRSSCCSKKPEEHRSHPSRVRAWPYDLISSSRLAAVTADRQEMLG